MIGERVAGLLLTGFSLVCTLGFVDASGAAGTARSTLPPPVHQAKAYEQHD